MFFAVFKGHPLGLWWLFKYCGMGGESPQRGIGLHADPAAVNINVWMTPTDEFSRGGGLRVFKYVPPLEGHIKKYNHEFPSDMAELKFREELESKGGSRSVDYAFNRAILFVSDQYHHSEKFNFSSEFDKQRMNLTMLFGDRQDVNPDSNNNPDNSFHIESDVDSPFLGSTSAPLGPEVGIDLQEDWGIFN